MGTDDLPVQRERRPAGEPEHRATPATPRPSSSGRRTGSSFVERNVGAWMHVEHILGLYVFAAANRSGPTNMHNTALVGEQRAQDPLRAGPRALQPHPQRGDRGLRRHRPLRRPGTTTPSWQGARKITEALTAVDDDWGEAMFATNVVFEPLIGELFRSDLVHAGRPGQRRLRHPDRDGRRRVRLRRSATCAGRQAVLRPARDRPRVRRPQHGAHAGLALGLGAEGPAAARTMQPLWSQPDNGRRGSRTPSTGPRTASPESCPTSASTPRRS